MKPDYGLRLLQDGVTRNVDLFFYDFAGGYGRTLRAAKRRRRELVTPDDAFTGNLG